MNEQNSSQEIQVSQAGLSGDQQKKYRSAWEKYLMPASILVAGILVAGTSLYNTRVLLQTADRGANVQTGTVQTLPSAGSPQLPTAAEGAANVAERSDQPIIGNKNAKVTITEFSDFQCPFCEKFFKETYGQIKSKYVDTGKVKIVFRHFPLSFHQNAQKAAEASECANRQGKFSQYHDLLFQNSKSDGSGLNAEDLKKYADQLGLNKGTLGIGKNKFNECLDKGEASQVVSKDLSDGTSAGVTGTPSFFVNGKKIVGAQPYSVFESAIEEALK